ncbi:hypothetical protein N658DRAFT_355562 [Parathielavia hyrcaniae]|uniref:Uncharacterized protein n=1 Tax=Parathielavia hyrcaniae TaxID=113614 RepID=A0AAN6Q4P2_9PEZI|nr:hypothetical protein N658DRAFT_355562 [Parathielavia hyrcaniae]
MELDETLGGRPPRLANDNQDLKDTFQAREPRVFSLLRSLIRVLKLLSPNYGRWLCSQHDDDFSLLGWSSLSQKRNRGQGRTPTTDPTRTLQRWKYHTDCVCSRRSIASLADCVPQNEPGVKYRLLLIHTLVDYPSSQRRLQTVYSLWYSLSPFELLPQRSGQGSVLPAFSQCENTFSRRGVVKGGRKSANQIPAMGQPRPVGSGTFRLVTAYVPLHNTS